MDDEEVAVILPAAGVGARMKLETPKQFCEVKNRPIFSYTVEAFERVPFVKCIILVISHDRQEEAEQILQRFGHNPDRVKLVDGAASRHRSICCGVNAIKKYCSRASIVVIHDAVRPFVPVNIIREICLAAKAHGAAGAVRPLVSTIVAPDENGFLTESLDRSRYRNSEMPQAFQYNVITSAYEMCSDYDFEHGTECLQLALKYCNIRAKLIDGPDSLWKVTHARDLHIMHAVLQESQKTLKLITMNTDVNIPKDAYDQLQNNGIKIVEDPSCSTSQNMLIVQQLSQGSVDEQLMDLQDQIAASTHCNSIGTSVCLFLCTLDMAYNGKVQKWTKSMTRATPSCIFSIVKEVGDESSWGQVMETLTMLVHNQNKVLSGQSFIV